MTPPRDPGLQPERTRMAWHRTAMVMVVCALLALRETWVTGEHLPLLAAVLLAIATVAVIVIGLLRERQLAHGPYRAPDARLVHLVWLCPVLAAASFAVNLLMN